MHEEELCEKIETFKGKNSKGTAKIEIYGNAMIEKKVGSSGKTGRVYLPTGWVGHHVRVIRVD